MTSSMTRRSLLLIGCGRAALISALLLGAQTAGASTPGFQAFPEVTQGNAIIDRSTFATDVITVQTPTVVIDWFPFQSGPNDQAFLPQGHTAIFQSPQTPNFAVLNRILPSAGNVVAINGDVISRFQSPTGASAPAGFVAFYSPTGFLVGSTATFDVGSLLLTTLDPTPASFTNFAQNGGTMNLIGAQGSTARIQIDAGARITATAENSFFSVVAADVQMRGTANINGSHAYVAGEVVNLTFSNGLFDIEIPTGTAAAGNVLTLDGNIGGPASLGVGDNHIIYGVASAAGDPITMLLSGNLGFEPAANAFVENGDIVLAANFNVAGRRVAEGGWLPDGADLEFEANNRNSNIEANINIVNANITSRLLAAGTHDVIAEAAIGNTSFARDVVLFGAQSAELRAMSGGILTIGGNADVLAHDYGSMDIGDVEDATGGRALVSAVGDDSIVRINGRLRVDASAIAGLNISDGAQGNANAGIAALLAADGRIEVGGGISLLSYADRRELNSSAEASARGNEVRVVVSGANAAITTAGEIAISNWARAANSVGGASGGFASAGTAILVAQEGGLIEAQGGIAFQGFARGGSAENADAGSAFGGTQVILVEADSTVRAGGAGLVIDATAIGGNAVGGIQGRGGNANGGAFDAIVFERGNLSVTGDIGANLEGRGGSGQTGGNASGGFGSVRTDGGTIDVTGRAFFQIGGTGGDANIGFGGDGGRGVGGNLLIQARENGASRGSIAILGAVTIDAEGVGGFGGAADANIAAGRGGDGIGSPPNSDLDNAGILVRASAENAELRLGSLSIFASGAGGQGGSGFGTGAGGDGGLGRGGTVFLGTFLPFSQPQISEGLLDLGTAVRVNVDGIGGSGSGTGPQIGAAGAALGGSIELISNGGSVRAGETVLLAQGFGASGLQGGLAAGGRVDIGTAFEGNLALTDLLVNVAGVGRAGVAQGGVGRGGQASILVNSGAMDVSGDVLLFGIGEGGSGAIGGGGIGGDLSITVDSGRLTIGGTAEMAAVGAGGDAFTGTGGEGRGGNAVAFIFGGGVLEIGNQFTAEARGSGGDGQNGGEGQGGAAGIRVAAGSAQIGARAVATSEGVGGNGTLAPGGNGGTGRGGGAFFEARGTVDETGSLTIGGDAIAIARGVGGLGGAADGNVPGGRGGDGFGGNEDFSNQANESVRNGAYLLADADRGRLVINGQAVAVTTGAGGDGGAGSLEQIGGRGGDGTAGFARIGLALFSGDGSLGEGSARFGSLFVDADGTGGAGSAGGSGQGGRIDIAAMLGDSMTVGALVATSTGTGGIGLATGGGQGRGGSINLDFGVRDVSITGPIDIAANGFGGNGGTFGGAGQGGTISTLVTQGTLTLSSSQTHRSIGQGGNGGNGAGGLGRGGSIILQATDGGSLRAIDGITTLESRGQGGSASSGFISGSGDGGFISLAARNEGELVLSALEATSIGIGGSSNVADGGIGRGGFVALRAEQGSALEIGTAARVLSIAQGGAGGGTGGRGGDATGGVLQITAFGNSAIRLPGSSTQGQGRAQFGVIIEGGASQGAGGRGGAAGPQQQGTALILATAGSSVTGQNIELFEIAQGGSSSNGTLDIAGGNAVSGNVLLRATDEDSLIDLNVVAYSRATGGNGSGSGTGGTARSGDARLDAIDGAAIIRGNSLLASEAFGGNSATGTAGSAFSGIVAGNFTGAASLQIGDADTPGSLELMALARSGAGSTGASSAMASGVSFNLVGTSTITGAQGQLRLSSEAQAGGSGAMVDAGNVTFTQSDATSVNLGALRLGSLALGLSDSTLTAGIARVILSDGNPLLTLGTLDLRSRIESGASGAVGGFEVDVLAGAATIATLTAQAAALGTPGANLQTSRIRAVGAPLRVADLLSAVTGGDLELAAFSAQSGDEGFIGGAVSGGPEFDIRVEGVLNLVGNNPARAGISGGTVRLAARDLNLAGTLLAADTLDITSLETRGAAVLGGSASGGFFTFSQSEMDLLRVREFILRVPVVTSTLPNGLPFADPARADLVLRDLTINGSDAGGFQRVQIIGEALQGIVRVEGAVRMANTASGDAFIISAGERIEVVTPGGIRLTDRDGGPAGLLSLEASDIWAGDLDLIAQLRADRSFAGRNDLLASAAPGSGDPLGYLRGGEVRLAVQRSLLVRNTGSSDEPGGVLTGVGGLSISQSSPNGGSPLDVFAYGRRQQGANTFVTGEAFFGEVLFNRTGAPLTSYSETSRFNDCVINTGFCGSIILPEVPPIPPLGNPTLIVGPLEQGDPVVLSQQEDDSRFGIDFPEFVNAPLIDEDALLDDPVTAGGDASIYAPNSVGSN